MLFPFLYQIQRHMVPLMYLKTHFPANQCVVVGLVMNMLSKLTIYIKSSHVAVKYIRLSISCLN